ncbi:LysR family transcriptional regulator [Sphingomonas sp. KR1UV-12]|uniref:LysR family transcriptional regulator n=1 Tax=Sphingomonas aurea TaxID=3063994 RepID=A0ABT9EG24_9SPHN|nr:LysR family transcriptional regulator [Sphingomonas sp. KR1UV-12]MDP1025919.1 LysR family transcriptional regulator [Sphingomonas sp. KR1UV-12]
MIDRYLLRYFLAVVDQGNFSRAALHCRVSQPTLSVGIAKLEAELGRALFLRTNRRVELTAAGTRFAGHARRIEAEFAEAERDVTTDIDATPLRLGIVATLPGERIEAALAAARRATATERLEVVEGPLRTLLPLLDRGRIDALLGPTGSDPRRRRILFEEGYGMALPLDHPLAGRSAIEAQEVAAEPMIVRRHCEALAETSRHFTARGVRPFMAARTTSDERALAYVRAGLGITVMPMCYAGSGVAVVPLTGFHPTRAIGVLIEDERAMRVEGSEAYRAFVAAINRSES